MVNNCNFAPEEHEIKITNVSNFDTVTYSLFLIKGYVYSKSCTEDKIQIESGVKKTQVVTNDGLFRSIVELRRGENRLKIHYCKIVHELVLNYEPKRTGVQIVPIYIICGDDDAGEFQAPNNEPNGVDSALRRISIGARLIQTLFAEKLYESGLGRKTFQFEFELDDDAPECRTFCSRLDVKTARTMNEYELWKYFGTELINSELGKSGNKFLAFLACTRYNGDRYRSDAVKTHEDIVSLTEAHVALGGGGLALFGTACLHTWASSVDDIERKFLDSTPVDKSKLMDDSCYRGTYGACFSTTLGSVCHELGHTFDLGHTETGIMDRGFDHIDLFFVSRHQSESNKVRPVLIQHTTVDFQRNIDVTLTVADDALSKTSNKTCDAVEDGAKKCCRVTQLRDFNNMEDCARLKNDRTFFTRNCALVLFYHRWFNEPSSHEDNSQITYTPQNREIISTSDIKVVEIRDETTGMVFEWWEIKEPRKQFVVPEYRCPHYRLSCLLYWHSIGHLDRKLINDKINQYLIKLIL